MQALLAIPRRERRKLVSAALTDLLPEQEIARRVLLFAALQVHFARMASLLQASDLRPVATSACPACRNAPVSSAVVGWPKAYNTRFCTCSLCGTMGNAIRVACVDCTKAMIACFAAVLFQDGSGSAQFRKEWGRSLPRQTATFAFNSRDAPSSRHPPFVPPDRIGRVLRIGPCSPAGRHP